MTENYYKFGSEGESFMFDCDTQELCCVLCKDKYNVYNDPFTIIIDTNSFIEVTYELCIKCIYSFQKCNNCNRELNEPWDRVYFNIIDKTYYCSCCYDDKRNKFYKKCYNSNCLYCSEKYNIKPNVIKWTNNISLDDPPKKRNINKGIIDKGIKSALSCGNFPKKSCKTLKVMRPIYGQIDIIKQENEIEIEESVINNSINQID